MPAPSMTTEVDFANLALGHLGEPKIASLDDDHPSARACARFFTIARDATLRGGWYNFATAWNSPAQTTDGNGRLALRFLLPADCLAVREVYPDSESDPINDNDWAVESSIIVDEMDAEIETMLLVTNIADPLICYTRSVATPRLWTPDFGLTFSYKLGELIGPDVARDSTAIARCAARFETSLPAAKRTDTREKARQRASVNLTSWGAARR